MLLFFCDVKFKFTCKQKLNFQPNLCQITICGISLTMIVMHVYGVMVTCYDTVDQAYNLFYHILNNYLMIQIGETFLNTIFRHTHNSHARIQKILSERANFDNVCFS